METRKMKRAGLEVGVIALGGEYLNGRSEQETCDIFEVAIEHGVNYLDIFMPEPETRSHIGAALRGRREKMYIQGHLCTVFEDGQYKRTRDLEKTKHAFADLLTRLETDHIEVGMIHYVDSFDDLEATRKAGIFEYARALREQGVIGCIGLSSHNPEVALAAVQSGEIDVLMFSINAAYDLERPDAEIEELMGFQGFPKEGWAADPARRTLYETCERMGVAITVMKPLGAGSLLDAARSPFGVAMTAVQCCHYALSRPGVVCALPGCSTVAQMRDVLRYNEATEQEKSYSHIFAGNQTFRMTGKCMYCNHCLPCVARIDIAMVNKLLDLAQAQEQVPETVAAHYAELKHDANDCIACGACERRCPFGVKVRDNMERARNLFGKK